MTRHNTSRLSKYLFLCALNIPALTSDRVRAEQCLVHRCVHRMAGAISDPFTMRPALLVLNSRRTDRPADPQEGRPPFSSIAT